MPGRVIKFVLGLLAGIVLLAAGGAWYLTSDGGRAWLAGHASLYTGHDIRIDGPVSLRLSPPGLGIRRVSASRPAGDGPPGPWLEIGGLSIGLSDFAWPPTAGAPLRVAVRDARLDVGVLAGADGDVPDAPPAIMMPPFPVLASLESIRLDLPGRKLPALQVERASLDAEPGRGLRAGVTAMLGRKPVDARIAVTLTGPAAADRVPGRIEGRVDIAGLDVAIEGTVEDLARLGGVDLELAAAGDIASNAGVSTAFTEQAVSGRLAGNWGRLAFEIHELRARTVNGRIAFSGTVRQQDGRFVVQAAEVDARTENLAAFLGDFDVDSTVTLPASVRGGFGGDDRGLDIRSWVFTLGDGLATLRAAGRIARDDGGVTRLEAGELSLRADDARRFLTALGMTSSPVDESLSASARVSGPLAALSVEDMAIELGDGVATVRGAGRIGEDREGQVRFQAVDLSLQAADVGRLFAAFGETSSRVNGRLSATARVQGGLRQLSIENLAVNLGEDVAVLHGTGRLTRDESGETHLDAGRLSLLATDAAAFVTALGATTSPVAGRLAASVELDGPVDRLALDGLEADLGDGSIVASGLGELVVDPGGPALRLTWDLRAADVSRAVPRMPLAEWLGGRGTATGELHWRDGLVALDRVDAQFTSERGTATVTGEVSNVLELAAPRLALALDADGTRDSGFETFVVNARLPGGLDQSAQVNVTARLKRGRFEFDGDVESPRERYGVNGDFRFEVDPDRYAGRGPGVDGAWVISGRMENGDLENRRFEVTARIEGTDGRIHYRGQVEDTMAGGGTFALMGMDANVLAAIHGVEANLPNLVYLTGELAHDEGGLTVTGADLLTGASHVSGGFRVQWPGADGAPGRFTLNARSPGLYLADLGIESADEDDGAQYFSRAELPFDRIADLGVDIVLSAERLHTKAIVYRDVTITAQARGGVLRVSSDQQLLGGRGSNLVATVDARESPPLVDFRLTLDGIDPGELRAVKAGEDKYSGDIDAELDIRGAGRSVGAILGSADGHFLVRINHAVLPNRKLNLLSADFLFEALRTVNPFVRQSDELAIDCGVMAFIVKDGVARADKSVVIKGRRLLIAAEGEVDLDTERVAFAVRPKAQEGFGLNTSGLVKFIGIGGTLSKPVVRTDPRGLLATGASIGAAFASGGMSLFLQNMFDRLTTGKGECERVETTFRQQLAGATRDRGSRADGKRGRTGGN